MHKSGWLAVVMQETNTSTNHKGIGTINYRQQISEACYQHRPVPVLLPAEQPMPQNKAMCSETAAEQSASLPQPACSFVARQAAATATAGTALSRATDCKAAGNTRATLMWQNVLQYQEASCLLHYGKADCIALALVTTGHSLCGTTSHTENDQMWLVGPT